MSGPAEAAPDASAAAIRDLNDEFRRSFSGGRVVLTSGVAALPDAERHALMKAVQGFEAFTPDNDPHGEHDFGDLTVAQQRFFWKIDYVDHLRFQYASPDRADITVATRVLTIMLAEEY